MKTLISILFFACTLSGQAQSIQTNGKTFNIGKLKLDDKTVISQVFEKQDHYYACAWSHEKNGDVYESQQALLIQLDRQMNFVSSVNLPLEYNKKPVKQEFIFDAGDHFACIFSQSDLKTKHISFYRMDIRNMALNNEVTLITMLDHYDPATRYALYAVPSQDQQKLLIELGTKTPEEKTYDIKGLVYDIATGTKTPYNIDDMDVNLAESRPQLNKFGNIFRVAMPLKSKLLSEGMEKELLMNRPEFKNLGNTIYLLFIHGASGSVQRAVVNPNHAAPDLQMAMDSEGNMRIAYTTTGSDDSRILRTCMFGANDGIRGDTAAFEISVNVLVNIEKDGAGDIDHRLTKLLEVDKLDFIYVFERRALVLQQYSEQVVDNSRITGYGYQVRTTLKYQYGPALAIYIDKNDRTFNRSQLVYKELFNNDYRSGLQTYKVTDSQFALLVGSVYFLADPTSVTDMESLNPLKYLPYKPENSRATVHTYRGRGFQLLMEYKGKDIRFTLVKFV